MATCKVCESEAQELVDVAEQYVLDLIKKDHPDWVSSDGACPKCIKYYENLDTIIEIKDSSE